MTSKKTKAGMASVNWIHMGQWPCFVGFTTSEKAFKKELKRLNVKEDVSFMGTARANATTHTFYYEDKTCYIVTCAAFDKKKVSRESYAALIAHEVEHVLQYMRDDYARGDSLGVEADAYLMQYLTMMMLADAWKTKRTKAIKPASFG